MIIIQMGAALLGALVAHQTENVIARATRGNSDFAHG